MEFTTSLNRKLEFENRLVGVTQNYKHSLDVFIMPFNKKTIEEK